MISSRKPLDTVRSSVGALCLVVPRQACQSLRTDFWAACLALPSRLSQMVGVQARTRWDHGLRVRLLGAPLAVSKCSARCIARSSGSSREASGYRTQHSRRLPSQLTRGNSCQSHPCQKTRYQTRSKQENQQLSGRSSLQARPATLSRTGGRCRQDLLSSIRLHCGSPTGHFRSARGVV